MHSNKALASAYVSRSYTVHVAVHRILHIQYIPVLPPRAKKRVRERTAGRKELHLPFVVLPSAKYDNSGRDCIVSNISFDSGRCSSGCRRPWNCMAATIDAASY